MNSNEKVIIIIPRQCNQIADIRHFLINEGCLVLEEREGFLTPHTDSVTLIPTKKAKKGKKAPVPVHIQYGRWTKMYGKCRIFLVQQEDNVNLRNIQGKMKEDCGEIYISETTDALNDIAYFFPRTTM